MSTRAMYTFKDADSAFHVYVHFDGYPTGAAAKFKDTLESGKVWALPRFEADEFAAGFVSANKTNGGGTRLTTSPQSAADIAYYYTVYQDKDRKLRVKAQTVNAWKKWTAKTFFDGLLTEFIETAQSIEEKLDAAA